MILKSGGDNMSKDFNQEVGSRLFKARKQKDMTRAQLGKIINLHESTIKRYEDGEIKSLDVDKMKDFAKALNCSPAYLMGWDDTPSLKNPYIEKYNNLNNDNKQTVNNLIDDLSEKQKAQDDKLEILLKEAEEKAKRQALLVAFGGKNKIHEFTDEELKNLDELLEKYKNRSNQ